MSRRIDIELTSAQSDGTWTWRAAGARQPKGVLDGKVLYEGVKVGDVARAEADFELDGITILSVVAPRGKRAEPERIELLSPSGPAVGGVTTQLTGRSDRADRRDRDGFPGGGRDGGGRDGGGRGAGPRSGGPRGAASRGGGPESAARTGGPRSGARPGGPRPGPGSGPPRTGGMGGTGPDQGVGSEAGAVQEPGAAGDSRSGRSRSGERPPRSGGGDGGTASRAGSRPGGGRDGSGRPGGGRDGGGRDGGGRDDGGRDARHHEGNEGRPSDPAERHRGRRLNPANLHRQAVLESLPPEQQPIAEQILRGGMPAVRTAIALERDKATAEGRQPPHAEQLLALAEQILPRLKAAEWRDRAEAVAKAAGDVSLRDLRSVVAGADVARDDETRSLAAGLREALDTRVNALATTWTEEIDRHLRENRLVRALRLAGRPPEPSTRLPAELSDRLSTAAGAALAPHTPGELWVALLEAVADSPVRRQVKPLGLPGRASPDVTRAAHQQAARVPALTVLLGIAIPPPPGPRRPNNPAPRRGDQAIPASSDSPAAHDSPAASASPAAHDSPAASESPAPDAGPAVHAGPAAEGLLPAPADRVAPAAEDPPPLPSGPVAPAADDASAMETSRGSGPDHDAGATGPEEVRSATEVTAERGSPF